MFETYLERVGERLMHVHLSENDGSRDQSLQVMIEQHQADLAIRIQSRMQNMEQLGQLMIFSPSRAWVQRDCTVYMALPSA